MYHEQNRPPQKKVIQIDDANQEIDVVVYNSLAYERTGWYLCYEFLREFGCLGNSPFGVLVKDVAVSSGGLGFDSLAGQIGYSVANRSPPLRRFLGAVLSRCQAAEITFATRYTLRRGCMGHRYKNMLD